MKLAVVICAWLLGGLSAHAQYYFRGEVRDEKQNALSNAKIRLHTNNYIYFSGSNGAFGIMSQKPADSISISMDGYQPVTARIEAGKYLFIELKILYPSPSIQKNRLISLTRNLKPEDKRRWTLAGETYSNLLENEFIVTRKYPETGFAINTDKASYSNIRRFLNMNTTVPPPSADSTFGFRSYISDCPWDHENLLLYLNVCARRLDTALTPASNLVFLVDISGSMDMPNRLPLLKAAFKLLVDNLRAKDTVTIVVYGSTVGVWLNPTSGKEKDKIRKSIEELYPGGATPGESGIRTAYRVARSQFIPGGNNRVILATDGDFNVGQASEEELEKLITQHQESGIYLTCLGVGMGNYKDSKLEMLARKGNGNFAYLDNEREAEKVLVKELTQTLYTVADDAFMNIRFNSTLVKEYRLIGFDNKLKTLVDTLREVEGGEVGSGHSLLVMFELKPNYPADDPSFFDKDGIASITVNYKRPGDSLHLVTAYQCPAVYLPFKELPECYRFASSVVIFASLLKDSKYVRHTTWNDAAIIATNACDSRDALQKEFIEMIGKAKKIYTKNKKRKREE